MARVPKRSQLALGVAGVALTGVVDYVTGYEIRLFPLYFLPVAYVAATHRRTTAVLVALLSAIVWTISLAASGTVYSSAWVWPVNFASQFLAFGTVAYLVSELRRRLHSERALARRDALTGLLNSRGFRERAEILFAIARRSRRPLTFAYVDLDHFKRINDDLGHDVGDRALQETARTLTCNLRDTDLVARVGGDEFALLLPDTSADSARVALERVREKVAAMMRDNAWPATASVGAVSYVQVEASLERALKDADARMYRAKEAGRDRVQIEEVRAGSELASDQP